MPRSIIIGGGVAGLATAALLAREGHEVTLLERQPRLGGRAGVLQDRGFRFDTGPSWYLMPQVFDRFFAHFGTSAAEQLTLRPLDPGYRVFPEPDDAQAADPIDVPRGRAAVTRLFEELEPGSTAELDRYVDSAQRATALAERRFLYNPFTRLTSLAAPEVLGRLPELTRLLLTSLQTHVERRFSHPVLRQILQYPAVFLATRPEDAPAIYHLMSALDLDEGVQYPDGGFWELVQRLEALARDARVTIITEAEATRITTRRRTRWPVPVSRGSRRRSEATGVFYRDSSGEQHLAADQVISCADLHHTETHLLGPEDRSHPERRWRSMTSGPGAVLVMLGVKGELPELAHHSLFFSQDWRTNFSAIFGDHPQVPDPASSYVCRPSATDPAVAPPGHENLFFLVPVPADTELGHGGVDGGGDPAVERIADDAIDQVAAWAGVDDLRERIVVRHTVGPADFAEQYHSWRGGVLGPAHTLGQSAMFRAQNASRRVAGLYYAGATVAPGVGVPMCLISAELVLKHIRGDSSAGPLPPLNSEA